MWDIAQRKCLRRWKDEGGFGSRLLRGDPNGRYLAIGSVFLIVSRGRWSANDLSSRASSGMVNIYGLNETAGADKPKLFKSMGNLTTAISTLRFNPDSQLLAIASNIKKDQMRLVRL